MSGNHNTFVSNLKVKGNINTSIDNSNNSNKNTTINGNVYLGNHNKKHEEENNNDSLRLNDKYTSLFAEDGQLKTEQITITKQKNGEIDGVVSLTEQSFDKSNTINYTYTLKGKYLNKILTAEYYSQQGNIDERGAINLKLIDKDILSGFCSFSKIAAADDEIRVSPYVWVFGENKNLANGTFDFCTKCYEEHKVCCCASPKVDMPVFLNNELGLIRSQLIDKDTGKNSFSKSLSAPYDKSPVRQMKRVDKKNQDDSIEFTKCHFFDKDQQICKIYDGRPIDCRLFPYDIKMSDNNEYVIGYYTNLCKRNLPDASSMKKRAHILRPYFFLLYPYLHIFTSDEVCTRLKDAEFEEIAKFRDFVF